MTQTVWTLLLSIMKLHQFYIPGTSTNTCKLLCFVKSYVYKNFSEQLQYFNADTKI